MPTIRKSKYYLLKLVTPAEGGDNYYYILHKPGTYMKQHVTKNRAKAIKTYEKLVAAKRDSKEPSIWT